MIRLRHYTNLAATIHLLREQIVTLRDPEFWDDRNDAYFMAEYKRRMNAKTGLIETSGLGPRGARGRHRRRGRLASPRTDQSVWMASAASRELPPERMPGRLNCSAAFGSEEARTSTLASMIDQQIDRPPFRPERCRERH
jgi:hypothetical protein